MDPGRLADALAELIRTSVDTRPLLAYGLIALAMLLENLLPPIPSELIMPLAGYLVHEGRLQLVPVVLAGLLGTVLGAWFWYGVGRLVNEERLERLVADHGGWLGLRPSALAASRRWFARHGAAVVFWGRLLPGIRPFVSLPAGIELMPQGRFLAWTAAGSLLWITALTVAGQALGAGYRAVLRWLEPLAVVSRDLLLLAAGVGAAWLLLRWWRTRRHHRRDQR